MAKTIMNTKKIKPTHWMYGFALLPLLLGCLLISTLVYPTLSSFPNLVEERYNLENLTQMIVPSSVDLAFSKPGAYGIYYEYYSFLNGKKFDTGKGSPSLECNLTSKKTGGVVRAVPDYVETNTYSTIDRGRVGVLIMSITIQDPGPYSFACDYQSGKTQPEIVVSLGPNFMWEFFKISWEMGRSILVGVAILLCAFLASTIILLVIAFIQVKIRKRLGG
jgi:hypothetical protein